MEAKAELIAITHRDVDVPLSARGEEQAAALGRWFAHMPAGERPEIVLTSPYLRARRTAEIAGSMDGFVPAARTITDERLREKEFGILDRLTRYGIEQRHPEQAELRRLIGKFYFRPPGGESWCDVILRLRSVLDMVLLHHSGQRVLIVGHQVVVLCFRYLLENLSEQDILTIDADADIANCSITEYAFPADEQGTATPTLRRYNFVAPLTEAGAPVTAEPDPAVAAR